MIEWLTKNSWAIMVLVGTMVVSYTLYGARVDALEKRVEGQEEVIEGFRNLENANQVTLAKMQKDIEYIKIKVNEISND